MKVWVGLIATGLAISASAACAQGMYPRAGYGVASDLDAPYLDEPPYAALPPEGPRPLPPRIYGPRYGERSSDERVYAPSVLPPTAVYGILRDNGYSPLGIPQQRGFAYTISVISPDGDDGRLVIDARSGRILRFLPAFRMGDRMGNELTVSYGPAGAPPVLMPNGRPRVASRSPVPLPKPMPARAQAKPADAQASIQKPADVPVPTTPPVVIEAKPTPASPQPTQEMPAVQGLE